MSEISIWFEREFRFDFPAELYPNFRVRLRGTPSRLEDLTRGVAADQLILRPDGKWSIQENAGHLLDLEDLWLARLHEFLAGADALMSADLSNTRTDQARHNDRTLEEILAGFRSARLGWVEKIERLAGTDFARKAKHPRLGVSMRLVDHLYFVAEHDDHHLARIWELRRQLSR